MNLNSLSFFSAVAIAASLFTCAIVSAEAKQAPIVIEEQGSFAVGGTVVQGAGTFDIRNMVNPAGQTLHGDHGYVQYQVPVDAKKYPLVFLHGAGQSKRTWETTPDGREGFQNIFLRKGYPVYLVDQPRRGEAGRSTVPAELVPAGDEQMWFSVFRLGQWPAFYPGVQFSKDPEALNQYFRQMTPNTGAYDSAVISDAMTALFEKTGNGILITHSQGGGPGWETAMKSEKVKGIISYEPGAFPFPEGEAPPPMPSTSPFGALSAAEIPKSEFMKLTRIPIVLYFGDNIPEAVSEDPGKDNWRTRLAMAKMWVETVNRYGGDATLVHLPEIGVHGNTHFPFSDLNNLDIAELMEQWIKEKGLN